MADETLADLRTLIGLKSTDQDDLLNLIIKNTTAQLRRKLHLRAADDVPAELGYVLTEVAVRRYNRISNEGMTSYGQEGESITFTSDDFADFSGDIADWLDEQDKQPATFGRVQFINGYGGGC